MSIDRTLAGRRVRLTRCTDEWTTLAPGDEGTVTFMDDAGTLHIRWDNGSRLGLVADEDRWELLPESSGNGVANSARGK